MATRPIVPRANGEGSLGVNTTGAEKYWGGVFTNELNGADAIAMAGYSKAVMRKANTAYLTGVRAVAGGLPAKYQLFCKVSGTTDNADIVLPSTFVDGATFTDGGVTWQIQEIATTTGALGFRQPSKAYEAGQIAYHASLPTGYYLECTTPGTTSNGDLSIGGGISVYDTITDGTVTWTVLNVFVAIKDKAGNDLEAVAAKSLSSNGYVKYSNGLIIQWGTQVVEANTQSANVTFPISFSDNNWHAVATNVYSGNAYYYFNGGTTSGMNIVQSTTFPSITYFSWIAVGY
jgi:hypothetical protein